MSWRRLFRYLVYLLWLAIPVLLWWALRDLSWHRLATTLGQLRLHQLLGLALINVAIILTFAARLALLFRHQGYSLPLSTLARYWLVGFAISYFTPGPQFGGAPFQIYLVQHKHSITTAEATAAVTLSKLLERMGNALFLGSGLAVDDEQQFLREYASGLS